MLTQSSPLNTVELQCPYFVVDESMEMHVYIKHDSATCANAEALNLFNNTQSTMS